jgi:predicted metal-dependent hydrolase
MAPRPAYAQAACSGAPDDAEPMTHGTSGGASEAPAIANLPGGPIPYTLRHSPRARGLRVVLYPDRGVVVTIPATRAGRRDGERRAVAFLAEREAWLRRHLGRQAALVAALAARGGATDGGTIPFRGRLHRIRVVPAVSGIRRSYVAPFPGELVIHRVGGDRRSDASILERWMREVARDAIEGAVRAHAGAMGVQPATVTLRDPRTRWGSASRTGRLSFSWRLVLAPAAALETVVVHELAHLLVFGHGPTFWALVASRRPDHRVWRRWLHDHSTELHTALDPAPLPLPVSLPA